MARNHNARDRADEERDEHVKVNGSEPPMPRDERERHRVGDIPRPLVVATAF
jgi:hypothetical protein